MLKIILSEFPGPPACFSSTHELVQLKVCIFKRGANSIQNVILKPLNVFDTPFTFDITWRSSSTSCRHHAVHTIAWILRMSIEKQPIHVYMSKPAKGRSRSFMHMVDCKCMSCWSAIGYMSFHVT